MLHGYPLPGSMSSRLPPTGRELHDFAIEASHGVEVVAHNLTYPHEIWVNGKIQTSGRYAYQSIAVEQGRTTITVKGEGIANTRFFIAERTVMATCLELRLLFNAFLFFFHLTTLVCCTVYCFMGRNRKITGIFMVYVLSSLVKGLNLGELDTLALFLGMSVYRYSTLDAVTTAINTVIPIYLLLVLFSVRLRKRYLLILWGGSSIPPLAIVSKNMFARSTAVDMVLAVVFLSVTLGILAYGYYRNKKGAIPVMVLRLISMASSTTYVAMMRGGNPMSNILFFCNCAYLGATLYFLGMVCLMVVFYLQEHKKLVEKEKEWERILLLKGLGGHDLKHPVLAAKLNNQYLLDQVDDEEQRTCIQGSLQAIKRLEMMIANINDYFNRRDATGIETVISLKTVLKQFEEDHRNARGGDQLVVHYGTTDCFLSMHVLDCYRILENLTDNAGKFGDAGGEVVSIGYQIFRGYVLVQVKNRGGKEFQNQEKLFDMFYREDQSRSIEGFGIGLAVVKQLVENAGGTVSVDREAGIYTVFAIRLPIVSCN